ncbi:hypothetical protein F1C10_14410 [Sphingomonas sp. NBWT7]|uniref:hypothetical protein n=1 Tax=Sphingomonas sp. NBWT7 TaxID=2596913 RepID=UPI001629435E|nr:hypothetical protein [Sphingomonas sp. NBWT7]QNE32995.1 hypothetical protein F1C10_14410 [Sphingomonas sp. NBWT7]
MIDHLFYAASPLVRHRSIDRPAGGSDGTRHPSFTHAGTPIAIVWRPLTIALEKKTKKMSYHRILAGMIAASALTTAPAASAQQAVSATPAPVLTAQDDASMGCSALGVEMARAAQQFATAQAPTALTTTPVYTAVLSPLDEAGRAYQAQQNAQQLGNVQALAARGGVSRGAATAAIGSVAALQQVAANGGNVQDAASSVAGDMVGNQLAKNIPGGKLIGGMMGGLFKKKKPAPVAAVAAAPAGSAAQARLTYLGALYQAKGCK